MKEKILITTTLIVGIVISIYFKNHFRVLGNLQEKEVGVKNYPIEAEATFKKELRLSERKPSYKGVPVADLTAEQRIEIAFAGGSEEHYIPSHPRLSEGFTTDLREKIRENMVPLTRDPVWESDDVISEITPMQIMSVLTDIRGFSAPQYYPISFASHDEISFFWRGHHDTPMMGYAINHQSKVRYKWRLDEFGFSEFMENSSSDHLMMCAETEFGQLSARALAERLIRQSDDEDQFE